jgi:hypothetical protein
MAGGAMISDHEVKVHAAVELEDFMDQIEEDFRQAIVGMTEGQARRFLAWIFGDSEEDFVRDPPVELF